MSDTDAPSVRDRLRALGLELPTPPAPAASYVPWRRERDLVFVAGQLPFVDGRLPVTGRLGAEVDTETGIQQARLAGLNALAVAKQAVGDLESVGVAHVLVFVASVPTYFEQHVVANGASDLFEAVLGERGRHARSAVAVPCLPLNGPVEVQALFTVAADSRPPG